MSSATRVLPQRLADKSRELKDDMSIPYHEQKLRLDALDQLIHDRMWERDSYGQLKWPRK